MEKDTYMPRILTAEWQDDYGIAFFIIPPTDYRKTQTDILKKYSGVAGLRMQSVRRDFWDMANGDHTQTQDFYIYHCSDQWDQDSISNLG